MLGHWAKAVLLACVLSGLCLPVQANTTGQAAIAVTSGGFPLLAQTDLAIPPVPRPLPDRSMVRVALLLPMHSSVLRTAAEVVHAGFQAGFEREPSDLEISVIETGDAPEEVLAGYDLASAENDIVVGPLSRTGVTALVQRGAILKPTVALTVPDNAGEAPVTLPSQLLVVGLSVEEEAKQIAEWVATEHPQRKAVVLYTDVAWQRRVARAFELQSQELGREVTSVELVANDGYLSGSMLLQLKRQIEIEAENGLPVVLFAALDARQARHVRALMGADIPLFGTSQLNPLGRTEWAVAPARADMDGTRLLDLPWQIRPDHPAVMAYPAMESTLDQKRNADLERLYALGIDAYRVARELAYQNTRFELDGVTGKLSVHFSPEGTKFSRVAEQAVYQQGKVVPLTVPP